VRGRTILLNPSSPTYSGQALFADGSQTLPSIAFSSDPDTGFFWQSSGFFVVTNNGAQTVLFSTTQFSPASDGVFPIGGGGNRWSTINTKAITIGQSLSNPTMGIVTLSGGTGTASVQTTAVAANSRIFLTHQNATGTTGTARVTSSTNGVGFTIVSSSSTDTSTIAWFIVLAS